MKPADAPMSLGDVQLMLTQILTLLDDMKADMKVVKQEVAGMSVALDATESALDHVLGDDH